eukprot:scaffold4940_cov55-Cyclotella_meneghiniana.AAC.3
MPEATVTPFLLGGLPPEKTFAKFRVYMQQEFGKSIIKVSKFDRVDGGGDCESPSSCEFVMVLLSKSSLEKECCGCGSECHPSLSIACGEIGERLKRVRRHDCVIFAWLLSHFTLCSKSSPMLFSLKLEVTYVAPNNTGSVVVVVVSPSSIR